MSSPTTGGAPWSPRTPLSVNRLAKIANSFGYNLPSPSTENSRRSPSPNAAASGSSSYVLQVIPPSDLPHGADDTFTSPPTSASGYHPKYARGILVPVRPTLQSQLSAIAREYALPSTSGLVLYLVSDDAPGPRLSEDIWKILWLRIMNSDNQYIPPPTPRSLTLLSPGPWRSSPYTNSIASASSSRLNPSLSIPSPRIGSPTPSIVSLASAPARTFTKHAQPPSSGSPTDTASVSELGQDSETPLTSADPSTRANSLESPALQSSFELALPGLSNPHALVPILAKVEFEIDKRQATWYAPWLRSRRMNHAKRRAASGSSQREDGSEEERERRTVIDLTIGTKDPMPFSHDDRIVGDYAPLADSPIEETDPNLTIRIREGARDPLADVFGEDEDQWGQPPASHLDDNVVPLALTPDALDALESSYSEEELPDDVEELKELINAAKSPPPPERSSTATIRKNIPPPLILSAPNRSPAQTPQHSPSHQVVSSVDLPYLRRTSTDEGSVTTPDIDPSTGSTSAKSDNRKHSIYVDMDDFDDMDDLDDSVDTQDQVVMRAQLDKIQKSLFQLSPRDLTEFDEAEITHKGLASPSTLYSTRSSARTSRVASPHELTNADVPGFRSPEDSPTKPDESDDPDDGQFANDDRVEEATDDEQPAWPATPFAVLKQNRMSGSSSRSSKSSGGQRGSTATNPGVPQLSVNGVTTAAPAAFTLSQGPRRKSNAATLDTEPDSESAMRKREAEQETTTWRLSHASSKRSPASPLIPLSPDPFGRFPSQVTNPPERESRSSVYWEDDHAPSITSKASRFSVDDEGTINGAAVAAGDPQKDRRVANRQTLINGVKGITSLWRKSSRAGSMSFKPGDLPPVPPSPALPTGSGLGRSSPSSSLGRESPVTPSTPGVPPVPSSPSILGVPQRPSHTNPPSRPSRPRDELIDLPTAHEVESSTAPLRVPAMLGGLPEEDQRPPIKSSRRESTRRSLLAAVLPPAKIENFPQPPSIPRAPPASLRPNQPSPPPPSPTGMTGLHPSNPQLPNGSIQLHPTGPMGNRPRIGSSSSPIMPAKMMPGGGRSAAVMNFDQETPYPIPGRKPSLTATQPVPSSNDAGHRPRRPSSRSSFRELARDPSPPVSSRHSPSPSPLSAVTPSPPAEVPAPRPKSILKSTSFSAIPLTGTAPPAPTNRPRKLGRNSSLQALAPELPPSPKIPEQFLSQTSHMRQGSRSSTSLRSKGSSPSSHSYSGGSRSSHETTDPEELDDSQFEMVSPKLADTKQLSYPYHDMPMDGSRI